MWVRISASKDGIRYHPSKEAWDRTIAALKEQALSNRRKELEKKVWRDWRIDP